MLSQNDYKVLAKMYDTKTKIGLSRINGVTINDLVEKTGLSYATVRRSILTNIEHEFVDYGVSNGKQRTFYITEKGALELNDIAETSLNINKN